MFPIRSSIHMMLIHNQVKDLGMTLTEKWSTDNTLNTTVDVADKLLPGLKVGRKTMIMNS